MRFTLYTDYALLSLVYIAVKTAGDENSLTSISALSEDLGISRNHAVKVVYSLSQNGYLKTVRGHNGGIRLAMRPEEIVLGNVVADMEDFSSLMSCSRTGCRVHTVCRFKPIMRLASDAFLDVLRKFTLADLLSGDDVFQRTVSHQANRSDDKV